MRPFIVALGLVFLPLAAPLRAEPIDYSRSIRPLLKERCYACHGALKQKGKLRLDTVASLLKGGRLGPAVTPGDATGSLLIERVSDPDARRRMPPEGKPLTDQQVADLKAWIGEGALAPAGEMPEEDPREHWAFRQPVRPPRPAVTGTVPHANPIDDFISVELTRHGLVPAPPADRATLLRRVTLDLIGLPPSRDELHAFLADNSPDAYERVVDRLLNSPQYGERWARHWMDVWRYSDWYGRRSAPDVMNSYPQIWRWRDWIVRSLNEDRRYDRMVMEMLAADEICPDEPDKVVATGFLVRNWFKWNYNQWMRDNVEHTAKAFLGLTLNCCHCHDHKYDPVTQEEYFRFRAFFEPLELRHDRWPGEAYPGPFEKYVYGKAYGPIRTGLIRVMDEKLDAATYLYTGGDERNQVKDRPPITPGVPAALGGDRLKIDPVALPPEAYYPGLHPQAQQEELAKRRAAISGARTALAKSPADASAKASVMAAEADLHSLEARVAADNARYGRGPGDPDELAHTACRAERLAALATAEAKFAQAEIATDMARKQPAKSATPAEAELVAARRALDAAREALRKDGSTYTPLGPVYPKTSSGRRTALARWIASNDNPLTARVAVNHLWAWHFGRPLVETTNNFGRNGKRPTHPALLDWLAVELMESGWRMKHLHRLIVTSDAYCRASLVGAQSSIQQKVDPDNIYLAHFPTLRMEAEVVRDSMLQAAGELDLAVGGPEIPHEQGLTSRRRSLYFAHHGESKMEFLELFDAANPCDAYSRTTSVLPQQALALSNCELELHQGRTLAAKLSQTAGSSNEDFIRSAFEQVLGRGATQAEMAASLAFLERQIGLFVSQRTSVLASSLPGNGGPSTNPEQRARENLVHALFNHNDFVTMR